MCVCMHMTKEKRHVHGTIFANENETKRNVFSFAAVKTTPIYMLVVVYAKTMRFLYGIVRKSTTNILIFPGVDEYTV